MKTISIALLAIGMTASAQVQLGQKESYFSVSLKTDARNLIVGSKPTENNPALDLLLNANMVKNNFELSAGYENFDKIGFERYSVDFGWHFPRYIQIGNKEIDITVVPSAGFSLINRYGKEDHEILTETQSYYIYGKSGHIAFQGNLSFRVKLTDKILIDWTVNALTRPDLKYLYPTDSNKSIVFSNFVGVHYTLKEY